MANNEGMCMLVNVSVVGVKCMIVCELSSAWPLNDYDSCK